MIHALDHIQLAHPAGAEGGMRMFYCALLGMTEIPKPPALLNRGGFWATAGSIEVHFGVDPAFHPAKKAHPAFVTADLTALAEQLGQAGYDVKWDDNLPDVRRFFVNDPVGNRVELIEHK